MASFVTSPKWVLIGQDLKRWALNMLYFSAPILGVFFGLLKEGISVEKAWPVAALSLYGALADLFKKWSSISTYKK